MLRLLFSCIFCSLSPSLLLISFCHLSVFLIINHLCFCFLVIWNIADRLSTAMFSCDSNINLCSSAISSIFYSSNWSRIMLHWTMSTHCISISVWTCLKNRNCSSYNKLHSWQEITIHRFQQKLVKILTTVVIGCIYKATPIFKRQIC